MSVEQDGGAAVESAGTKEDTAARPSERTGMGPIAGLFWALLGGLAAWGLVHAFDPIFEIPEEVRQINMYSPPEMQTAYNEAAKQTSLKNHAVILAQLGGLLGALLAFGNGVARRSVVRALGGLCLGGVLGAAFGAAGSLLGDATMNLLTAKYGVVTVDNELSRTTLVQALTLGTMGGGIGLALGIFRGGLGGAFSAVFAGILGGVFAGMLFPFSAAWVVPNATTENLVPRGDLNRLLWMGLPTVLVGLAIPGMKLSRK